MNKLKLLLSLSQVDNWLKYVKKTVSSHAIMLVSEDNDYLNIMTTLLLLTLNCNDSDVCCLNCGNCQKIIDNNAIDIKYYPTSKNILVGDIENIVDSLDVLPFEFEHKYYVLYGIEKATVSAQNKLLKSLEEPPKNVRFILTANNSGLVLPTIFSRVVTMQLPVIPFSILKDKAELKNIKNIDAIMCLANDKIGKLLTLIENESMLQNFDNIFDGLLKIKSSKDIAKYIGVLTKDNSLQEVLDYILFIFSQIILVLTTSKCSIEKINLYSKRFSLDGAVKIVDKILDSYKMLQSNVGQSAIIESLIINILEVKKRD